MVYLSAVSLITSSYPTEGESALRFTSFHVESFSDSTWGDLGLFHPERYGTQIDSHQMSTSFLIVLMRYCFGKKKSTMSSVYDV